MALHQPLLLQAKLDKLHPTQITVGKHEVEQKRKEWRRLSKKSRNSTLVNHCFPAVAGPDQRYYIVDHHHLGLALLEENIKTVNLTLLKDLSWLDPTQFWRVMDHHQWTHPFDSAGIRRDFTAIPFHLNKMQDDPYRSLAGELRHAGGYAKDVTPFSEFLWADFLRNHVPIALICKDFNKALIRAKKISATQEARYLPGWHGVTAVV